MPIGPSRRKWKKENPDKLRAAKKRHYERGAQHDTNSRRPWTEPDQRQIVDPDRPVDRELAKRLGRTVKAIQKKRHDLKEKGQK